MHWPQITWIALSCIGLGVTLQQHNQPKTGDNNFFHSLIASLIVAGLLWAGGFFG